jgi:hypothetical protein
MADYTTNLKVWGSTGQEHPDNYSYLEDEAPVDAWDNFVTYNLISDVKSHLIPLTNSRIESDYGSTRPTSPEDGHLFYDSDSPALEQYRASDSSWHSLALGEDLSAHESDTGNPHSVTLEQARTSNSTLSGSVDLGGNNLNGVGISEFQSGDVRVSHAARALLVDEHNGTSWTTRLEVDETGASVTGSLSASGNLTVTGSSTFNSDASFAGSQVGDVGTLKFTDSDSSANNWTVTENGTSGNLEAVHGGTKILDLGDSAVNILNALRENGDRVATRPWIQDGFSMSGLLEVNSDIRLATGQSIEDGNSGKRFEIFDSNYTIIRGGGGDTGLQISPSETRLDALSGRPIKFEDLEGNYTAVQYDSDASAGVLRTPGAAFRVEGDGNPSSGAGVENIWTGSSGAVYAYDRDGGGYQTMEVRGSELKLQRDGNTYIQTGASLVDLSATAVDLRLATGQAIEDGSGTDRFVVESGTTRLNTESGNKAFRVYESSGYTHSDASSSDLFKLPRVTSDTGQAAGDMWYRSDLD